MKLEDVISVLFIVKSLGIITAQAHCHSRPFRNKIYMDCARLNLTDKTLPHFNNNVLGVDLGFNLLSVFPPNLPKSIAYINVTANMITFLNVRNMRRYPNLLNLTISYCYLRQIELGTFKFNRILQHLDVSNNEKLSLFVVKNISLDLRSSSIKVLNLEKLSCTFGPGVIFKTQYVKDLRKTRLESLNIASNRINYIERGVLATLPKSLRHLNIADNLLSYGVYLMQFGYLTSLEVLNVSYGSSFHEVKDFFYRCNDFTKRDPSSFEQSAPIYQTITRDRNMYSKSSKKDHNKSQAYKKILKLTNITTKMHKGVNYMRTDKNVGGKSLTKHHKRSVAKSVYLNSISQGRLNYSQNIASIVLKKQNYNFTFYLPPKLKILYIYNNLYSLSIPEIHFGLSYLTHIYAQNNIVSEMNGPVYGFRYVTHLNIANNFCSKLSSDFFIDFVSLLYLDISNNVLVTSIQDDIEGNIFRNQLNLRLLNLSLNRLIDLPFNIFGNLNNLEHLNLSNNKLEHFKIKIDHMHKLSNIDLSFNQISIFDRTTTDSFNSLSKNVSINLFRNPLLCSCQTLYFLDWMNASPNITFINLKKYTCSFPNGTSTVLKNLSVLLRELRMECASYTAIIVIITLMLVIAMTTIVCGLLYRYRWKLRYLYYVAKRQYRGYSVLSEEPAFRYDAFISYADEDSAFINEKVDFLEKDNGLNLCIHSRDFIPGTQIAENVTNAIHNSRRTVCIMTTHYLRSYWCMFELNMARMETMYSRSGENAILLILLEKGSLIKEMPLVVLNLIETDSYLEYPKNTSEKELFWTRFVEGLR